MKQLEQKWKCCKKHYRKQRHSNNGGMGASWEWGTTEKPDRLQDGTNRGRRAAALQSMHGRIGFGSACGDLSLRDEGCFDRGFWRNAIISLR
jgi:hypothetical protein